MDNIIHLAIFPKPLHQFGHGDTAEVRRQSCQMLDVSFSVLVGGGALVVRVREHQDVLRDDLPGAFGDFPYFVVSADEGAVFGHGAAFGDEPGHVEDFELAVIVIPVQVRSQLSVYLAGQRDANGDERYGDDLPPACGLCMLATVVSTHYLGTVVFPRSPRRDLDSLCVRFQLAETFHQGASYDRCPAVRRLHDFDGRVNCRTDGLAEVGILAETTNEEDSFDFLLSSGNLSAD